MKLIVYLVFFYVCFKQSFSQTTFFCSTLCGVVNNQAQCTQKSYANCKNCALGFIKATPTNVVDACIVNPALYNSTGQKYQPVGVTPDINYNMQGHVAVQVLTVNASLTGNCKDPGNPVLDYTYYGNLTLTNKLLIDHNGIFDVGFWRLRIRYLVMIINQWRDHSYFITVFENDASLLNVTNQLDQNTFQLSQQVCGGDRRQRINIVDHQFSYNQSFTPLQFSISAKTDSPTSNIWGVKQIVIMARVCHPYCTACYGDSNRNCTACNYSVLAMLSGNKCDLTCDVGYGFNSTGQQTCIRCVANCTSCLDFTTYCINCTFGYYLWIDPANTSVIACLLTCPQHSFRNNTAVPKTCDTCDVSCLNCSLIATNCTSCNPGFYLYNNTCYTTCPAKTYPDNTTAVWRCVNCDPLCANCSGPSTNCSLCETTGTNASFLLNTLCTKECGPGYFQDTAGGIGPNVCTNCSVQCTTCDINSTYCFSCATSFYLYNNICSGTCLQPGFFADNVTWTCLDCNIYCVGLTTKLYFSNNLKDTLFFDLTFTQNLNWTSADIQAFVTVTENDPILDLNLHMDISYFVISPKIYRVQVKPKGYIFIYNSTFTFKTNPFGGVLHQAINGRPFKMTNYDRTQTITWFLIKTPSLSDTQNNIIDSVSKFSDQILQATTSPYIQEIKKGGAFLFLLSGAQATSTSCLVNNIPSQNLYQGVRFWASFVFFDVPQWQQNSDKTKYLVSSPLDKIIQNARLLPQDSRQNRTLFDTSTLQWRFLRTGHTSFFIFDVYINVILITLCWILLLIGHCCISHKVKYKQYMGKFYSFTHKVHEVSIFYITLSTLLQWLYFDSTSIERWISLGICIFCNVYFLAYELYIYYDMINYPKAKIGNEYYEYYVLKYSSLLKNIRFEQFDPRQSWSVSHWIRPYNYHIFSFYKKFLMMIALPIFYLEAHAQISALIAIQFFEIVRFLLTRPFKSKIRNGIRLGLQIVLLGFFGTVLIQGFMVIQIMKNDSATLSDAINLFYKVGWAGFCLVFIFNIGHILIVIFDIVIGCRTTNKQSMNEARKMYYMQKINTYEQQNQDVPLVLLNQWVKLGNLNDRNYQLLPDINLRVQLYKIRKVQKGYEVQIRKIFDAFMNIQFNYQKEMNLTAGKKIQKQITLRKQISPELYNLIDELYNKYYAQMDFEYMTIKTFQKVIQSNLQPGQKIPLNPQQMFQRIQLQTFAGQSKVINLQKLLPSFPIKREQLIHLI